jgi:hypothetical protein
MTSAPSLTRSHPRAPGPAIPRRRGTQARGAEVELHK